MIEAKRIEGLRTLAQKQVDTANRYAIVRREAANAETDLKILLTAKLKELRGSKKNLGIEMAILMLCEDNSVAVNLYNEWNKKEAEYKGLERLLEAQSSQLIFEQSLMKFQGAGEKWS